MFPVVQSKSVEGQNGSGSSSFGADLVILGVMDDFDIVWLFLSSIYLAPYHLVSQQ